MLGQVAFITPIDRLSGLLTIYEIVNLPDDPTDASVDEAEFVAGSVNRFDAWIFKVPFESCFRVSERSDEAA